MTEAPTPDALQLGLTLSVLAASGALFVWGRPRADVVALLALGALTLGGVLSVPEALAGFSNPLVLTIAGLFVVGAGVLRTGLAERAGGAVVRAVGARPLPLLAALMALVAVLSALMSNTGTVAVLMPVIVAVAWRLEKSPALFLMPVAFMSGLGGLLTLVGSPPNLIASAALREAGHAGLGFFSLLPLGLLACGVGVAFLLFFAPRLLPQRLGGAAPQRPGDLLGRYALAGSLFRLRVDAAAAGATLRELAWPERGVTALLVERGGRRHRPGGDTRLEEGDRLLVLGEAAAVRGLGLEAQGVREEPGLGLAELGWPRARGVQVLALRRGEQTVPARGDTAVRAGDLLLLQGPWRRLEALGESRVSAVLLGDVATEGGPRHGRAPLAAALLLGMMALLTLEVFEPVVTVWLTALGMVLGGCLRDMGEAYRRVHWESVVLIGAMLPLATALQQTGAADLAARALVEGLGTLGPLAVMAGVYLATMALSQLLSNTATAVLMAPVAVASALTLGVSPVPLVVAVAVAASMAFATPMASPPGALVMGAGGYRFADYLRLGLPLQLTLTVALLPAIPLVFPF